MLNFVIQVHPEEYHDFVSYLDDLEFQRIALHAPGWRFKNAPQLILAIRVRGVPVIGEARGAAAGSHPGRVRICREGDSAARITSLPQAVLLWLLPA